MSHSSKIYFTYQAFLTYLLVGFVGFALFIFPALYFGIFERFSPGSQAFVTRCRSLQDQDYSKMILSQIRGYCFESCNPARPTNWSSCVHAVKCEERHIDDGLRRKSLLITRHPGAPEAWYCRLMINESGKVDVSADFVID